GAEHQAALDADAEREAAADLRVDACSTQYVRIDHSAPTPLDPARTAFEGRVPQVELGRRLGEREEVRPKARLGLFAEQLAREVVQRALQVRHRDALVDDEALDLSEHRKVRRIEL